MLIVRWHGLLGAGSVKAAADVEILFRDKDPKLNEIKQVAYHVERDALQCNHWDEADKWVTERYIQHNPLVQSGRSGVVVFFGSRPKSAACEKLNAPVVAVLADGDLVTVVTVAHRKDAKGNEYTTTRSIFGGSPAARPMNMGIRRPSPRTNLENGFRLFY